MRTLKHSIPPLVVLIGIIILPLLVWAATSAVTITTVDTTGGSHTSLAIDSNGFPVISFYVTAGGQLKVAKCHDSGCTTEATVTRIDPSGGIVGQYSTIKLDGNNFPVISYFANTGFDLKVAKCYNSGCTTGTKITTVDSSDNMGQFASMAVDGNGFPVISYHDATNYDLKIAKCHNSGCTTSATITVLDETGQVGQYTSVAVDDNDAPVISYYDITNSSLKVAKCHNSGCTTGTTITTVDSTDAVGKYTSIAVDSNGFPVISYYDETNTNLKVAKCSNSGCTTGTTITTVDSTDSVGFMTSIALDTNDNPSIAYYDITNFDLKFAKCSNSGCTTGTTITTVDSTDVVGQYPSLAIDSSGYPIISYRDVTNSDLKVADCLNTLCAAPAAPTVLSPSNGASVDITTTLSGTGSAVGNYIRVTNKHGRTICTAPVQSGFTWSCTTKPLNQSETLTIVETDSLGFESDSTTLTLRVTLPSANSPGQSSGGGGGGGGARSSTLSRRMNTVESTTTHAAASTQETSTESTDPAFKVRVCNRVMNRFATDPKMLQRVNMRLNQRFSFICK